MKKLKILFLLLPLLITSCGTTTNSGSQDSNSGADDSSIIEPEDKDEYDKWLDSWSQPGHLYFHYNRGEKKGYDDYCLWLWQHAPQDLEGALWAFSGETKVSANLTLKPMSQHWMTNAEVKLEGDATYLDSYGVIADVDLYKADLVGGKSGDPTSYQGMKELGFLLPQQSHMDGKTNWVSDGGRETFIEDFGAASNWRTVKDKDGQEGKAIHIFVSTGSLYDYTYFAGSGVPEAKINPIDEDTSGKYSSAIDTQYSNALGNSSTSESFKKLGAGYQIFVASFNDSNEDGIGDIRGIINSLDYLSSLGVEVLWLTPIQKSDSYHGYDISDYYAVDKRFGTIDDYRELLYKAHQKGMKVLMDLVLNHTSKGNVWFSNSQWGKVEDGINWRDVYTWKYETDLIEKYDRATGTYKKVSVKVDAESDNPSWYRDGESHYYYYGKFGSGMPEINYLNAATRKMVIDMAKYWMSFGLDGFRLDAVKHIFMRDECYQEKDQIISDINLDKQTYDDEKGEYVKKDYDYSSNLTKNIMWWKEFAHGVKADYPNCFLVGENFDGWGTRTAPYYQALDSQFSFSTYFHVPAYLYNNDKGAINFVEKQAGETFVPFASQNDVPLGDSGVYVPGGRRGDFIDGAFTSNHDVERAINRANGTGNIDGTTALQTVTGAGDQVNKAKIQAAITMLNPGVSWIYYGDELGMSSNTEKHITKYKSENCIDIWYRQPFLWKDTKVRPNYKSGNYIFELDDYNKTLENAETQMNNPNSMFTWYKDLISIKKMYPAGAKVEFHFKSQSNVLVLRVTGQDNTILVIYINVGKNTDYLSMNPDEIANGNTSNVKTMGGAPSHKGGNIGEKAYSISVFKK